MSELIDKIEKMNLDKSEVTTEFGVVLELIQKVKKLEERIIELEKTATSIEK